MNIDKILEYQKSTKNSFRLKTKCSKAVKDKISQWRNLVSTAQPKLSESSKTTQRNFLPVIPL